MTILNGHLGPVAHEPTKATRLGWSSERHEIATGAVGAQHGRSELRSQHSIVGTNFVLRHVVFELVQACSHHWGQPLRISICKRCADAGDRRLQ